MKLVSVGTMAFDAIETPYGKREKVVGGAATYIALAASYLVQEQGIVSVVGDDFPQEYLESMRGRKINLEGLEQRKGEKSFFWSGKYHQDMNSRDTLATELNVLADFQPKVAEVYKPVEYLMLGNLTPQVQKQVIEQLVERPKLIALDTMNFWMDNAWDELHAVLKLIDMLIINDEEARQLSGEYNLAKAYKAIRAKGPRTVIIKKGEHGALLCQGKQYFFAPALPIEDVYDPTGAGDTFAGGVMGFLARTDDTSFSSMKTAVIYGSALASLCVESFGTERLLSLSKDDIDKRIQRFVELTDFSTQQFS